MPCAVVASSMKLEYPLNDSLPEIEHSRDRLLARLHRFRQDTTVSRLTTDEDYALLYAYGMFASSSFPAGNSYDISATY